MLRKRSLEDLQPSELRGRSVLLRADLNVPLENGRVADDMRIRATLPTLRYLREAGAKVILFSHLGRPRGVADARYSLRPVAERLSELLGGSVAFSDASSGPEAKRRAMALGPGDVLLLENCRFEAEDTTNDPALAADWAALADVFVNDAFGAAHRAHASTTGVAEETIRREGMAVTGFLLQREVRFLDDALRDPERPFVAVLGGAKVSGKIDVIQALLPRVDKLLLGGAMANTFFRALGLDVGSSLVEEERVALAKATLKGGGDRIVLPVDCVVAERLEMEAAAHVVARDSVGQGLRIGDVGPRSRESFSTFVDAARTVVWNGPMGVFELEPFRGGTVAMARAVAGATERGALTVVGGGDSVAAVHMAGVSDRITHISTGGGASLELLAGVELPGLLALSDA